MVLVKNQHQQGGAIKDCKGICEGTNTIDCAGNCGGQATNCDCDDLEKEKERLQEELKNKELEEQDFKNAYDLCNKGDCLRAYINTGSHETASLLNCFTDDPCDDLSRDAVFALLEQVAISFQIDNVDKKLEESCNK